MYSEEWKKSKENAKMCVCCDALLLTGNGQVLLPIDAGTLAR